MSVPVPEHNIYRNEVPSPQRDRVQFDSTANVQYRFVTSGRDLERYWRQLLYYMYTYFSDYGVDDTCFIKIMPYCMC